MVGHSGYDIVSTTTGFYGRQIRAGAYLPLDKSKLPNLEEHRSRRCSRSRRRSIPGNRYAVPYLHAMNGFVYNVDEIKARMPDAPTDSLAMLFDPAVDLEVRRLRRDLPGLARGRDPAGARLSAPATRTRRLSRISTGGRARRSWRCGLISAPSIRTPTGINWPRRRSACDCLVERLLRRAGAGPRGRHRRAPGLHAAQGRLEHHLQRVSHSGLGAASGGGAQVPQFHSRAPKVIAEITNDIHYGNDNLAARPYVDKAILDDPCGVSAARSCARGCTCRRSSAPTTTGRARGSGRASKRGSEPERTFSRVFMPFCDPAQSSRTLEMLACAPMYEASPAIGADLEDDGVRRLAMLSLIARWGHNVLLAGTSLLVLAVLSVTQLNASVADARRRRFQVRRRDVPRFPQHPAVVAHVIADQHENIPTVRGLSPSLPARPAAGTAQPARRAELDARTDRRVGRARAPRPRCPCRCAECRRAVRLRARSACARAPERERDCRREHADDLGERIVAAAQRRREHAASTSRESRCARSCAPGSAADGRNCRRNRRYNTSGHQQREDPGPNS